jgi:16S rRNA (cytosine967-C5)-methyltransferase
VSDWGQQISADGAFPADRARQAALKAMKAIRGGAYANLALGDVLAHSGLSSRDATFATELVYGTCRNLGVLDAIIEAASGRSLKTLQPGVVDVLRLGAQQGLKMRVPNHAAVSTSVALAASAVGQRVKGLVNAILRRVMVRDWEEWIDHLASGMGELDALALRTSHPRWIVDVYTSVLPADEVESALEADNVAPVPTLVVRPGLIARDELLTWGGTPTTYSPWGVVREGDPAQVEAVRDGRAGVQDEGSQLVASLLAIPDAPQGPWLDICAGPGGKAALLMGLARERGEALVAGEIHPHRAVLVQQGLRAYRTPAVVVADGTRPAWGRCFARVLVDAPCTGLGALRRRPEARWRKGPKDLDALVPLQKALLASAFASTVSGGLVVYITCSPHPQETIDVIESATGVEILDAPGLLGVPDARSLLNEQCVQLWAHRHHTDSMFAALLRVQ